MYYEHEKSNRSLIVKIRITVKIQALDSFVKILQRLKDSSLINEATVR